MGDQVALSQLLSAKSSMRKIESTMLKYMEAQDLSCISAKHQSIVMDPRSTTTASFISVINKNHPAYSKHFSALKTIPSSKLEIERKTSNFPTIERKLFINTSPNSSPLTQPKPLYYNDSLRKRLINQIFHDPIPLYHQKASDVYQPIENRPILSVYDRAKGLYPISDRFDFLNENNPGPLISPNLKVYRTDQLREALNQIHHLGRQAIKLGRLNKSLIVHQKDDKDDTIKSSKSAGKAKNKSILKKTLNKSISKNKKPQVPSKTKSKSVKKSESRKKLKKKKLSIKKKDEVAEDVPIERYLVPPVTRPSVDDVAIVKEEIRKKKAKEIASMLGLKLAKKLKEKLKDTKRSQKMSTLTTERKGKEKKSTSAISHRTNGSLNKQKIHLQELFKVPTLPQGILDIGKKVGEYTIAKTKESSQDKINRLIRHQTINPLENFMKVYSK